MSLFMKRFFVLIMIPWNIIKPRNPKMSPVIKYFYDKYKVSIVSNHLNDQVSIYGTSIWIEERMLRIDGYEVEEFSMLLCNPNLLEEADKFIEKQKKAFINEIGFFHYLWQAPLIFLMKRWEGPNLLQEDENEEDFDDRMKMIYELMQEYK